LNQNKTICSFKISLTKIKRAFFVGLAALILCGVGVTGASAQASNVYITQSGSGSGVCTTGVQPVSFFNNSANWGSGSGQIGPGTTVHLCGTFNAPAGADGYLQFQGSGTSGNPITLLWEKGAIVQAPYFSFNHAGLDINWKSWIVVDGGTNGILQNTAEGTGLSYQQDTALITGVGNNVTVKNLSMLNVYVHLIGDNGGGGAQGFAFALYAPSASNLTIGPNNTFTQCNVCVKYGFEGGEHDLVITGNNFALCNQAIELGPDNSGVKVMTNIQVDHNTYAASRNWDNAANYYHHNFFHPFTNTAGSSIIGKLLVFDNTATGDVGQHSTSFIFLENNNGGSGGHMDSWYVFNNVFNKTNTDAPGSSGLVAVMPPNGFFLNNTVIDAGGTGDYGWPSFDAYGGATGWTVENNIFYGGAYQINIQAPATVIANKNVYYGGVSSPWVYHSTYTSSFSTWQAACSCDSGSSTGNPLLNSDMTIGTGSAASTLGANLSGMNISALDFDKVGTARPSGSWSSGAIQLGSSTAQLPKPPTGLAATVN
jgi:hypothetical protein